MWRNADTNHLRQQNLQAYVKNAGGQRTAIVDKIQRAENTLED